jgi:predicted permease
VDALGDLEEAHRARAARRGRVLASVLTSLEAIDLAFAMLRTRLHRRRPRGEPSRPRVAGRARGRSRTSFSWLDVKLGIRMLVRHPGLTVVGGLAMAFAIWVGAVTFEVVDQIVRPSLPLDEGDRIVGIQNRDAGTTRTSLPFLEDFVTWRADLTSIRELGAFRSVSRNLILGEEGSEPALVAELSAAGFRVARVPPLLGRTLTDADEEPDATPVVVIGYDVWQTRFAGDPGVVGRRVGVGSVTRTVIGVMPEDFAFPLHHGVWIPLARGPVDLQPGEGGRVAVFGRLSPGVSRAEAQAELDLSGSRRAASHPEVLGRNRPRVLPYARSVWPLPDLGPIGLLAANVFMVMLLVLVCGNVALLMFARVTTRQSEIAVRCALGASRARIVWQLFVEASVLGGVAAVAGLVAAGFGLQWFVAMSEADSGGQVPFWIRAHISAATVLYVSGLALLGAAIAGVGPALKVTGRQVGSRLRQAASGAGGMRLSGVWTVVIVAQVAVTVAFPATAFFFQRYVARVQSLDLGFAAEEYLSVHLEVDGAAGAGGEEAASARSPSATRLAAVRQELAERLAGEAGVIGIAFADRLPGDVHPRRRVELEETGPPSGEEVPLHRAAVASVDVGFFDVLEAPVRAGRGFDAGDHGANPGVAMVNEAFVEEILSGRNPIGRRVRYVVPAGEPAEAWLEIVGVVDNLGMIGGAFDLGHEPGIYHPLARDAYAADVVIHAAGDPELLVGRLRTVAATVDPALRLHDIRRLDRISESMWRESEFLYRLLTGVSTVALLLSLTGIYSVMSFTVSRRTREIGVRVALGSDRRRIVVAIFRRPLVQVLAGIGVGAVLVSLVARGLTGSLSAGEIFLVALYSTLMLAVCMLACIVPTRRALGIEPNDALRAEG